MIDAIRIQVSGATERAMLERDLDGNYMDVHGRTLTDSGRTTVIEGWGPALDGTVKILTDESGEAAYYIK